MSIRLHFRLAVLAFGCLAGTSDAQMGFNLPVPTAVIEYKNVIVNHYFLTANTVEMATIDSGGAGPGWYRTGFAFHAYVPDKPLCTGCQPVSRFYGTPGIGPNSHFFTAGAPEADGLKQPGSGWTYEGVAFSIPVPDAGGACTAGLVPVYRLYNNRWMFNDTNHRYVTDAGQRAAMIAAGWIDEGVRFCATGVAEVPLKTYSIQINNHQIYPSADCEDESVHLGSCIAVNNLPIPDKLVGPFSLTNSYFLQSLSGQFGTYAYAARQDAGIGGPVGMDILAQSTFVQPGGEYNGIHIDTQIRGASTYSSVNPLYQFKTADGSDQRLFPWRAVPTIETEIAVKGLFNVVTIATRGAGSAAYGHPTLEFIDVSSGHHLYLTMLAYATIEGHDFVAADAGTGKVIVSTTLRDNPVYGRNLGGTTMFTPSGYKASPNNAWVPIDFRVNRTEFQRIVDAARGVDPALSANPDSYIVDNFHFTNEVYGDGEIGIGVSLALQVLRRR